jgi:hypothetical protein
MISLIFIFFTLAAMAVATHFYGPLMHLLVIDVFALFSFQSLPAMARIAAIDAMGCFFLAHYLLTKGPPKRLVPVSSCAPLAVPSAFFGMYAVGTLGARVPERPGVPV